MGCSRVGHAFFKARATPIGNQRILPILKTLSAWCRNYESGFRLRIRQSVTKVWEARLRWRRDPSFHFRDPVLTSCVVGNWETSHPPPRLTTN